MDGDVSSNEEIPMTTPFKNFPTTETNSGDGLSKLDSPLKHDIFSKQSNCEITGVLSASTHTTLLTISLEHSLPPEGLVHSTQQMTTLKFDTHVKKPFKIVHLNVHFQLKCVLK